MLSQLWRALISAGGWMLAALTLAWLGAAASTAAPALVWWKSLLALGCFLAFTYALRVARRLDDRARPGWTLWDAGLVLAGGAICGVLVMRSAALTGALLIAVYLALEGLSLGRLGVLPLASTGAMLHRLRRKKPATAAPSEAATLESAPAGSPPEEESMSRTLDADIEAPDASISQQWTRREEGGGVEISGLVRGRFAAGETQSSVDLAFCPTLAATPELEFELLCDGEVEVQVAALRTYGARLDLKRRGDLSQALDYTLEIHVASGAKLEADSERETEQEEEA